MALYRLRDDNGDIACEGDAQDDDHALAVLGAKIGKTLAFDAPSPHAYMMQRVETNQVGWDAGKGVAVHVIDPPSN